MSGSRADMHRVIAEKTLWSLSEEYMVIFQFFQALMCRSCIVFLHGWITFENTFLLCTSGFFRHGSDLDAACILCFFDRGPKYHLLAHTTLSLSHIQDSFRTHDLAISGNGERQPPSAPPPRPSPTFLHHYSSPAEEPHAPPRPPSQCRGL